MTNSKNDKEITPAMLDRIIKLQEQEVLLKSEEIQLRKQNQQLAYDHAKASLEANIHVLENEIKHKSESYKYLIIAFILFIVLILGSLYLNKDEIVREIIKALIYIVSAGSSGYFIGKSRSKDKQDES